MTDPLLDEAHRLLKKAIALGAFKNKAELEPETAKLIEKLEKEMHEEEGAVDEQTERICDGHALLKKYMRGVAEAEGVFFIEYADANEEELALLQQIANEIRDAKNT